MHRHSFLVFSFAAIAGCSGAPKTSVAPRPEMTPVSTANREQTADQQVAHVLSRLTFGARQGDAEALHTKGVDRWIDEQLHPERIDDGALDRFVASNYQTLGLSAAELERKYPPPGMIQNAAAARGGMTRADSAKLRESGQGIRQITTEVQSARIARALMSQRQLQEVVTDFWLNHFSVYDAKGPRERYMLGDYENNTIRPNALGKFRTLLGAVAKSEAMLFYLDNWQSQADSARPRLGVAGRGGRGGRGPIGGAIAGNGRGVIAPNGTPMPQQQLQQARRGLNENYGRELLELHTLGVDGGYTQQDVINAARALTGWTLRGQPQGGGFQFVPQVHDAGEKILLGHKLAAGRGIEDGEAVLDIVARYPATAKYIAFKLARRFVSDTPPPALVARAAETFTRTDGDIRETVRTIITSSEFFARAAYRSKVKSPFEVVASAARVLGAEPDVTPRTAAFVGQLGQPIYGHQAPNGWPETGDQWMNTGAILNRINFGMTIAAGRLPGASPMGFKDSDILQTATRELQADGVIAALLGGDASPETRAVLISGENPLAKDPLAAPDPNMITGMTPPPGGRGGRGGRAGAPLIGGAAGGPPGRAGGGPGFQQLPAMRGLQLVVGLALGSPEFQRR